MEVNQFQHIVTSELPEFFQFFFYGFGYLEKLIAWKMLEFIQLKLLLLFSPKDLKPILLFNFSRWSLNTIIIHTSNYCIIPRNQFRPAILLTVHKNDSLAFFFISLIDHCASPEQKGILEFMLRVNIPLAKQQILKHLHQFMGKSYLLLLGITLFYVYRSHFLFLDPSNGFSKFFFWNFYF